jgi:DNA-binding winged helix-turn-helix (wHTH) protein/TolB-like protein/tetratricopeptide (TPR) repeat protein
MLYRFNDIEIDLRQYEIRSQGKLLAVEPKVFDLIVYLIKHRDRLISRDELFEQIWHGRAVSDTSLSNHIKSSRKILGDNGELQKVIKTIRSRGYQFIANIEEQSDAQDSQLEITPPLKKSVKSINKIRLSQIMILLVVILSLLVIWKSTAPVENNNIAPYLLVVPFSIASKNTGNWEAFADQITREIIQDLRKISGLTVVPPPSSFVFKSKKFRRHIQKKLPSVDHVLDGVISEGNNGNLRVSVALENIKTGEILWDGDFDIKKGNENLFTIQSDIAESVSKSLKVIMLDEEKSVLARIPTTNLKAYEFYVQGQYQRSLMTHESVVNSISSFDQAIALDPSFEAAYIAKAKAYRIIMVFFDKPKDVLPKVISSAIALLAINPESAQIKSSLGLAYVHAWLWEDAWQMLSEAQKKDPSIALTELGFALYHSAMGNADGVKSALNRANKLDPLNEEVADWGLWALMMVGEDEAAAEWGRTHMKLHPNNPYLSLGLAINEYIRGNYNKSISLATDSVNLSHRESLPLIILAQSYAASGNREKAQTLIVEVEAKDQYMCPYETAIAYALMANGNGNAEKVFLLLNEAEEYQSNCLIFTRNDPRLILFRSDPRYLKLLKNIGLDDESIKKYRH